MKTCMKLLLLLAMIFATTTAKGSTPPQQQPKSGVTEEYRAAVKALLDVTDYEGNIKENILSAYKQLKQEDNPYVDDFMNQFIGQMPDKMVDIYSKYFTIDEIKELTELNKNEIRIKTRKLQPQISQDFMQEGEHLAKGENSPLADIVVDKEFDEAMREYLEVSGFDEQMKQMLSVIENYYGIPSGSLSETTDQVPDRMVRVYYKYFTTSEIKQATALAKTPCIKKFNDMTPAITQDILEETRQLTMDLMKKIIADKAQEDSNVNSETPAKRPKGWFFEKIRSLNK